MKSLGIAAIVALASACLPHVEDPPLTATGEAPAGWSAGTPSNSPLGDAGSAAASSKPPTTCSGSWAGFDPSKAAQRPCQISQLDMSSVAPANYPTLSLVTTVDFLSITSNAQLAALPKLTSVQTLGVYGFSEKALNFPNSVHVNGSIQITGLMESIGGFAATTGNSGSTLQITNCPNLKTIGAFGSLKYLSSLTITGCPNIQSLGSFQGLQNLNTLVLTGLTVPNIIMPQWNMTAIGNVQLAGWQNISSALLLAKIQGAQSISIQNCSGLQEIALTSLNTVPILTLTDLPKFAGLGSMAPNVQVGNSLTFCNLPQLKGADMEAWRLQHAANVQFKPCPSGQCTGAACP